jgi:hypothetical protein
MLLGSRAPQPGTLYRLGSFRCKTLRISFDQFETVFALADYIDARFRISTNDFALTSAQQPILRTPAVVSSDITEFLV